MYVRRRRKRRRKRAVVVLPLIVYSAGHNETRDEKKRMSMCTCVCVLGLLLFGREIFPEKNIKNFFLYYPKNKCNNFFFRLFLTFFVVNYN